MPEAVQSLWIGKKLEAMELLTIASFLDHGHDFILWTYEDVKDVPNEIDIRDANEILPAKRIFRLKQGRHAGSVAHFSDLFRYKMLELKGGWWIDMDVTCLKPFDMEESYVFKQGKVIGDNSINISNSIIKCPVNSEVMRYAFEKANRYLKPENLDWHLGLKILNKSITRSRLGKYIRTSRDFGIDTKAIDYFEGKDTIFKDQYCVDWNKSWLKVREVDVERPIEGTLYQALLTKYGIEHECRNRNKVKD